MAIYYKELEITRPPFLGGNKWILKNLSEINVIFGRNGSGKSILLRNLLDQDRKDFYYVSPERSGNIGFRPDLMQQQFDPEARLSQRHRNSNPLYREEVVSRIQTYLAKRGSVSSSSIPLPKEELKKILVNLLPNFEIKIKAGASPYEIKRLESEESINNIDLLSSGEAEILSLGLDLVTICAVWELDSQTKRLLLIDLPDPHLHPELQQYLAKFLIELSEKFKAQMIIATHNTTLLSSLGYHGKSKVSVIYLNNGEESQKAVPFNNYLRELAACLGGHALMGPLFSYPILLVEGDDDYKIWSQAARRNSLRISVIPCNGERI